MFDNDFGQFNDVIEDPHIIVPPILMPLVISQWMCAVHVYSITNIREEVYKK